MNNYETNIFPIENCDKLTAQYRLFEIIGLSKRDNLYDNHKQIIIKKLSYGLSHPITIISKQKDNESKDYLVIKDDESIRTKIPNAFELKSGYDVYFQETKEVFSLDFINYDDSTREICRRFLQFSLSNDIGGHPSLWSPGSGKPFFSKDVYKTINGVAIYRGFQPRIVEMPTGGWGIEVHITRKYLAQRPLPLYMTRSEFEEAISKGEGKAHFVYHYGNLWYEVKLDEWSDLNASFHTYTRVSDGKKVSIIEDLREQFIGKSMPPEIANLPNDVSLAIYSNNRNEIRRIPTALCYRVLDTDEIGNLHDYSIIDPFHRRKDAFIVRRNYLKNLKFGSVQMNISDRPYDYPIRTFPYPDQEFRGNKVISMRGTKGAMIVKPEEIGITRNTLLKNGGCYVNKPFIPQFFLMPESIANAYGETHFIPELKKAVDKMHPTIKGWQPQIIAFDDRNNKRVHDLAIEILSKIQNQITNGGKVVVMIPKLNFSKRAHDELAAIIVSKSTSFYNPVDVSIMHSDTLSRCITYSAEKGYEVMKKGLYYGYIQGVALNKVLLNNERYPFVLATPLNADITVGIDVKNHIAGYVFTDKFAKNIRTVKEKIKKYEQISEDSIYKTFTKHIAELIQITGNQIKNITIQRDGRLFQSEYNGILKSIELLKNKGLLPVDVIINIIEIPKHSVISLRLFEIKSPYDVYKTHQDNLQVMNPKIGSWLKLNDREGFIVTTGREFEHQGSSKPLYIKKIYGESPLEHLLEDTFYLSSLSHTKPDDCSRNPITTKMCDQLINDYGGEFDNEKFERIQSELQNEELL